MAVPSGMRGSRTGKSGLGPITLMRSVNRSSSVILCSVSRARASGSVAWATAGPTRPKVTKQAANTSSPRDCSRFDSMTASAWMERDTSRNRSRSGHARRARVAIGADFGVPHPGDMKGASAILVLMLGAVPARAELPPELARAVRAFDEAPVRGDVSALEGLVADDYVVVNSDATVEDKRQFLADFKLPGFKIDPY